MWSVDILWYALYIYITIKLHKAKITWCFITHGGRTLNVFNTKYMRCANVCSHCFSLSKLSIWAFFACSFLVRCASTNTLFCCTQTIDLICQNTVIVCYIVSSMSDTLVTISSCWNELQLTLVVLKHIYVSDDYNTCKALWWLCPKNKRFLIFDEAVLIHLLCALTS